MLRWVLRQGAQRREGRGPDIDRLIAGDQHDGVEYVVDGSVSDLLQPTFDLRGLEAWGAQRIVHELVGDQEGDGVDALLLNLWDGAEAALQEGLDDLRDIWDEGVVCEEDVVL